MPLAEKTSFWFEPVTWFFSEVSGESAHVCWGIDALNLCGDKEAPSPDMGTHVAYAHADGWTDAAWCGPSLQRHVKPAAVLEGAACVVRAAFGVPV